MTEPSLDMFVEQLHTTFQLHLPDAQSLELTLTEAHSKVSNDTQELFVLTFRGPIEPSLAQNIYELEHQAMGKLTLFMVPVQRVEDGIKYEVVFNRLKNFPST